MSDVPVGIRTVTVTGLEGSPDGRYIFLHDVVSILTTLGMLNGKDFSNEVNQLKELL